MYAEVCYNKYIASRKTIMLTKYYTHERDDVNHIKEKRRNRVLMIRLNDEEVNNINEMIANEIAATGKKIDASKYARKCIFGTEPK
jgi:hypothetical protein